MTTVEVLSQDRSNTTFTPQKKITTDDSDADEDEDDYIGVKKVKGRRKAIVDSDDEESDNERTFVKSSSPVPHENTQESISVSQAKFDSVDARSPSDESPSSNNVETNSGPSSTVRASNSNSDSEDDVIEKEPARKHSDSDSEGCEFSIDQIKSKYYANKKTKYGANENERSDEAESGGDEKSGKKSKKSSKTTTSRKAKLAAIEEIHSVTQRLVRESSASLPYHNPKPRSLEDFLNRRKSQPKVPLKTHTEELSKVWKFTEDQEKTAAIVYKSEDEEENKKTQPNEEPAFVEMTEKANELENVDNSKIEESEKTENEESEIPLDSEELNFHLSELTESCLVQNSVTQIEPLTREEEAALEKQQTVEAFSEPACQENEIVKVPKNDVARKTLLQNSIISVKSVPKLSSDSSGVIELDDFPKSGTLGFIKRYLKHSTLKAKEVIGEKGQSDESELVNSVGIEVTEEKSVDKPSKKLLALKAGLQKKIAAMREQQLAKRVEEYKIAEEEFFGVEDEADDGISIFEELELDEKDKLGNEENSEKNNEEDESEGEILGDDVNEDDDDDDDEEDEKDQPFLDNKAQEVSDEEDTELEDEAIDDVLSTQSMPKQLNLNLDDEISPVKQSQLLDLCSGKFSSQALKLDESEDEAETSQNESTQLSQHERYQLNLDDSDEDDIIGPRPKKKVKRLSFSDDEDEEPSNNMDGKEPLENKDAVEKEGDDEVQEFDDDEAIQGDNNEEDEILEEEEEEEDANNELVEDEEDQLAAKLGKDFLEGEAELSESEWGSADEDERHLDEFEAEEGDKEKFSQRQLRHELEQIHARELLAEDKRKIRIMQELFLEDGELHTDGPKRQRLFRWYNQDENDIDGASTHAENDENDIGGDDEDEETWRKGRIERENFLRQQKIDVMESQDSELLNATVRTVKSGAQLSETLNAPTPPVFQKSPNVKNQFSLLTNRGSFLSRGEKILAKIAELTTGSGAGDARKGQGGNHRNMVFAIVSPKKVEQKAPESSKATKRKAGTSLGQAKKSKRSPVKKSNFLDRLKDEDT